MKKLSTLKWALIGFFFISPIVSAAQGDFGAIANNLFQDAMAVRQLVKTICIITGACFVLGGLLQYKKHRNNPTEVRLGSAFFSIITGLILIGMAFIPFVSTPN